MSEFCLSTSYRKTLERTTTATKIGTMMYENRRFTASQMGKLLFYPEYANLQPIDQSIVNSLYTDQVFQSSGQTSGYFKIVTENNGAIILQPSCLQALEYNAKYLQAIFSDIKEHLYYLKEKNDVPKDGTSLYNFILPVTKKAQFMVEFVYTHKPDDDRDLCVNRDCVNVNIYFKVVSVCAYTINNRCVLHAGQFLDFLSTETPFVGVLISGLINLEACKEACDEDDRIAFMNEKHFFYSLIDHHSGHMLHSDKYMKIEN